MKNIPEHYKLTYSAAEIEQSVSDVAARITSERLSLNSNSTEPLLAVCVLRGAVFFFTDLLRKLPASVEPSFCRTMSYNENNEQGTKGVRVWVDDVPASGRDILLVDDICDTGLTLLKLHKVLLDLGAKSVTSVVLIHRQIEKSRYEPSYAAMEYDGSDWFVGYGFDDGNRFRNAPDVYTIPPTVP